MSREDRAMVPRAWVAVVSARLALTILPWRLAAHAFDWLPAARGRTAPLPAEALARAVGRAARYTPGATCLVQALALHGLLARRGHSPILRFGVRRSPSDPFPAHAWVELDGTDASSPAAYATLSANP
jgi:transglutaminase superfamily protein